MTWLRKPLRVQAGAEMGFIGLKFLSKKQPGVSFLKAPGGKIRDRGPSCAGRDDYFSAGGGGVTEDIETPRDLKLSASLLIEALSGPDSVLILVTVSLIAATPPVVRSALR